MTERYVKINSEEEIPFEFQGMVKFQITDGVIEAVILESENGSVLRIVKNGTYSDALKVVTNAPKVEITKYKLQGSVYGLPIVPEVHETEHEAQQAKTTIECNANYAYDVKLEIVPVVELVDEVKL